MTVVLWDASALIKRYFAEVGSENADYIMDHPGGTERVLSMIGYSETVAALWKKKSLNAISLNAYGLARDAFFNEWVGKSNARLLDVPSAFYANSLRLIEAYNLNASDAVIITSYIEFGSRSTEFCLLATCDARMAKAAEAEGLTTANPETSSRAQIDKLLSRSS